MAVKVPIVLGGTGASNAADARANLGVLSATANVVVSNIIIGSGNVLHAVSGANVTFDPPGTTVVGAQFKTPSMHDLATQRVITLKSNNYSGNRSGDYLVPTMNIKAKYNNVSINTTGRILYANRFDDETLMPDTAKYEGFVAYDRNPGGAGELYFSNTRNRHKIYNANATLTPSQNNAFDLGSAASVFKELHLGANARVLGNVHVDKGLIVGIDDFIVKYRNPTQQMKVGIGTADPQHEVDIRANVYISGNLTVTGNTYSVDTSHLIISDPVIELGANTVGTPTLDTGVLMNRGNLANSFMGFDESQNEFVMGLTSDPSSVTTITLSSYAPLQVGPLYTNYSANIAGNASVTRSLAVGYTDGRIPRANLDVRGNVYITGVTTGATFEPTGDTSASDTAAIGYTSSEGLKLTGQGSAYDVTLLNDAAGTVFGVPTGETSILFPDSAKAEFGTGRDLRIYHDASNSYIQDIGTGGLFIEGSSISIRNNGGTEAMALFTPDGAVTLYHDNSAKFATSAVGISVTGSTTQSGASNPSAPNAYALGSASLEWSDLFLGDGSVISFGNDQDVTLTHVADNGLTLKPNLSVTRGLSIGWADGHVPTSNLDVSGTANVGILTATSLRVNGASVATTFLGLSDTPSTYSSQAGKLAAVNSSTNAIEFVDDNAVVMAIALG